MAKENEKQGTYLYAVLSDEPEQSFGAIGIGDSEVYTIASSSGEFVALVSDVPIEGKLRPERRNLGAHHAVVRKALESSRVVLPASFGTIAESPEGIQKLLSSHGEQLALQMKRIEGKVQMGARASYRGERPGVAEFLVGKSSALAQARDRLLSLGAAADRDTKIAIGQKFEEALSQARDEYGQVLEHALSSVCAEVKRNEPSSEKEMAKLACLVPKGKEGDFEAALEKVAGTLPDEFALEPLGPFPPYDFVELHLTAPGAGA